MIFWYEWDDFIGGPRACGGQEIFEREKVAACPDLAAAP